MADRKPLDYEKPPDRGGHIVNPAAILAAARVQHPGDAPAYVTYEEVDGGWRAYLTVPALDAVARDYGREPGEPILYGEGPTKQDACAVVLDYLGEQQRKADHLKTRMLAEDAMRHRRRR